MKWARQSIVFLIRKLGGKSQVSRNGDKQDSSESAKVAGFRSTAAEPGQAYPLCHHITGTVTTAGSRNYIRRDIKSKDFASPFLDLVSQILILNLASSGFSVSKAKLKEYSDKVEVPDDVLNEIKEEYPLEVEQIGSPIALSSGLRRRLISQEEAGQTVSEKETDVGPPIRLDAEAQAHIEKHRKLQEDYTDEMVELARQLKETSFLMNQSVQDTEKILDSTERAVEHSFAGTGHANAHAAEVYSLTSKTACFQWLLLFVMTFMFFMVVLLIRITRDLGSHTAHDFAF